ncbi:MAG: hypothetical protein AAF790_09320 [Planctomycetota bacterium]
MSPAPSSAPSSAQSQRTAAAAGPDDASRGAMPPATGAGPLATPGMQSVTALDKRELNKSIAAEIASEMAAPAPTAAAASASTSGGGDRYAPADAAAASAPAATPATTDEAEAVRAFAAGDATGTAPSGASPDAKRRRPLQVESIAVGSVDDPVADGTRRRDRAFGFESVGKPLLISEPAPHIVSQVNGPRSIVVGRRAKYRVLIANRGDAAAEGLVTRVRVPGWAEVVSTATPRGSVRQTDGLGDGGLLEWRLGSFAGGESAGLDLTLIAKQGKPIQLGVDWRHAPVGGSTLVEVQEPKLGVAIEGPEEVLFGKPQRYRLELSNPGTGPAEDVTVLLLPPGARSGRGTRHRVGSLEAGAAKVLEIELTPREAGELAIQARATAAGGLEAEATKRTLCLKPGLEVDWRGPATKYAGAAGAYYFRVRNPGTAPAEAVTFSVDVPAGFELTATTAGQAFDPATRRLSWKIGTLRPGDDRYLQIRGTASGSGVRRFPITATTADQETTDNATAATQIVAVADLRLEVFDPPGPVPVGSTVVYEVRVKNRGATAAGTVGVVALFSAGVEPFAVDGMPFTANDGRLSLPPIGPIAAGAEKVVKISARADRAGTHVFRAEVTSRDLGLKLSAQEMTKFYDEDPIEVGAGGRATGAVDRFVYPR